LTRFNNFVPTQMLFSPCDVLLAGPRREVPAGLRHRRRSAHVPHLRNGVVAILSHKEVGTGSLLGAATAASGSA
jgi:hypothetical protein